MTFIHITDVYCVEFGFAVDYVNSGMKKCSLGRKFFDVTLRFALKARLVLACLMFAETK